MRPTTLLFLLAIGAHATAADWPMWRRDAARSAESPDSLPAVLHLQWTRDYSPLKPAFRTPRLHFDAGYEPVVMDQTMFVASSLNDRVTALDTATGRERWRFYCEGPVRFAPVAGEGRVYFGSDDGFVYCVSAHTGELIWQLRAAPTERRVLGNGRLISMWPVRGGPVLHDGRLYFAAGVWSFEGVFIYCVDAVTGEVIWRNDDSGFVYGTHPHAAEAFGGVTPQGYLVVNGDELIVPCGQAMPASFDLATGNLKAFELPRPGRLPGGWFASAEVRRGEVKLDATINRDLHEDKTYQGPGSAGVRSVIAFGDRQLRYEDGFAGVEGEIYTALVADERLFVVTRAGRIHCFGKQAPAEVTRHGVEQRVLRVDASEDSERLRTLVDSAGKDRGYAVVWGARSFDWLTRLLQRTQLQLIVVEPDASRAGRWRKLLDQAGVYGQRIAIHVASPAAFRVPPYLASHLIIDDPQGVFGAEGVERLDAGRWEALRPHGGTAWVASSIEQHARLRESWEHLEGDFWHIEQLGPWTVIRRAGPLPGAVNYTGGWDSPDEHVRAPLGVLWFDDTLGHFKRSPQPWFVDGVMISLPKDWLERHRAGASPPYKLLPPVVSDVFTGRVVSLDEPLLSRIKLPERDATAIQPTQYRPPQQADAWKPKQPIIGERTNPLTGETEPRAIPKSYGCDGGVDYGNFYTMRSGTPAFYDKRLESGVCNISGPRSGCTNSIIPACGVLNVPYFYEGCTCSYPLPSALALISMPPEHEQWSAWGPGKAENIQRVGINLGAPGDRMTDEGTLWLDYPNRGGASPEVQVAVEPAAATYYYRHSLWMRGGDGWPWVAASGVEGASKVTLAGLKAGTYTIRLSFADPTIDTPGQRLFGLAINGQDVLQTLDIAAASGGSMHAVTKEFNGIRIDGTVTIELQSRRGSTLLSGVELVIEGL